MNISDAALDHAVMAEQLLSSADDAITRGALGELDPMVASMMADRYIAAAHVHATLATVPQPLEAAVGFTEFAEPRPLPKIGVEVGDRVIVIEQDDRRGFGVLRYDVLGTVDHVWHSEIGGPNDRARVQWDDGVSNTEYRHDQLRVVLDA